MRWKANQPKPKIGDKRISHRFLWLPLTIEGETRWLERAWIRQEYTHYKTVNRAIFFGWRDSAWMNPGPPPGPPFPRPAPSIRTNLIDRGGHKPGPKSPWPNVTPGGKVGGINQKPDGPRPEPPPSPPRTRRQELVERGMDLMFGPAQEGMK